jgi:hypothetical protein
MPSAVQKQTRLIPRLPSASKSFWAKGPDVVTSTSGFTYLGAAGGGAKMILVTILECQNVLLETKLTYILAAKISSNKNIL